VILLKMIKVGLLFCGLMRGLMERLLELSSLFLKKIWSLKLSLLKNPQISTFRSYFQPNQ
jgi:hypothetical protein